MRTSCTQAPQTGRRLTHEQFRIELAKELLIYVAVNVMEDAPTTTGPAPRPLPPLARLTERHFPGRLPRQTNCTVCSKKKGRKTTTFCCQRLIHRDTFEHSLHQVTYSLLFYFVTLLLPPSFSLLPISLSLLPISLSLLPLSLSRSFIIPYSMNKHGSSRISQRAL